MFVIAGLGNPGAQYEISRHNAGYLAVEWLRDLLGAPEWKHRFQGQISPCRIGGESGLLVRPETYMNASGLCLAEIARFYQLEPQDFIVIYDDVDLAVGSLRVRAKGSAGTHNGMRSVIEELGSSDFARVRIGIGRPPAQWSMADYVLAHFTAEETPVMRQSVKDAAEAAREILCGGVEQAAARYNRTVKPTGEKDISPKGL